MPEYTTCVQPADYEEPGLPKEGWEKLLRGALTSVPLLLETCDYILHGKLVCLGGDRCAIGRVTGIETVDDKSFPDSIDNDYSVNILLAPWEPSDFQRGDATGDKRRENYDVIANSLGTGPSLQASLIKEQPGMPTPWEPIDPATWPSPKYGATYTDLPWPGFGDPIPYPTSADKPVKVPTLHCEIEGERINAVCSTAYALSSPIPGWGGFCKKNKLFGFICKVVGWALTPIVATGAGIAWAAGANDNRDFQGAGSLGPGDGVVITGRWVYDAGHDGWNELHPVKTIQRIDDPEAFEWATFPDRYERWCRRVSEAPPRVVVPGVKPLGMTPEQEAVYENQRRPEHRWFVHPLLDGCEPEDAGPDPIRAGVGGGAG